MLYLFLAGILWGTIGIFVKTLNSLGADSSLIPFLRMSSALIIISILAFIKHGRKIFIRDKKTLFFCALLGFICNGLFNVFYTASIKLNGMGIACVLMYTAPIFTAIASRILFHEKFSRLKIFALTVTGGNIFNNADVSLIGILAGIGSGFGYGMAAIFGKFAGEKTDSLIISVYSYFFAVIFLLVFNTPNFDSAFNDYRIFIVGALYGFIPTALAYLVYYESLKKIKDTSKVPVIASIEPVTAMLLGTLLYNERLDNANFVGFIVVLFSIAIMMKEKNNFNDIGDKTKCLKLQ